MADIPDVPHVRMNPRWGSSNQSRRQEIKAPVAPQLVELQR